MGKSMYNFGKNTKEKARQLKQTEKTAKRLAVKKQKTDMASMANKEPGVACPEPEHDIAKGIGDTQT